MPTDFSTLICGSLAGCDATDDVANILSHLRSTLDQISNEISVLASADAARIAMIGPFLGRAILEVSTMSLAGRIDPFRLLVLRRTQQEPGYDIRDVWKSSFRWQGDVVSDKPASPWSSTNLYPSMTRALLGYYYDDLVWQPAMKRLLDVDTAPDESIWLSGLRNILPEAFSSRQRQDISSIYSALSKGIHLEFVMPPGALYDRDTVASLLQRSIRVVSHIGLLSHFVPHSSFRVPPTEAIQIFKKVETMEVLQ